MCLVGCQVSHTACSPHQPAGMGHSGTSCLQSCVLVLVHDWGILVHGSSEKVHPNMWLNCNRAGRSVLFHTGDYNVVKREMNVWPRQIPPGWRERSIFLIYHFWQRVQPECRTECRWPQAALSSGGSGSTVLSTLECGILPVTWTTKQQQEVVQCCWPWLPSAAKTQKPF